MGLKRKPPQGNVRRVRSNGQNLRYTITNKAGQIVQCESHQERKLALLLERDDQVVDYRSQPEILSWYDDKGKAQVEGAIEALQASNLPVHQKAIAAYLGRSPKGLKYYPLVRERLQEVIQANQNS